MRLKFLFVCVLFITISIHTLFCNNNRLNYLDCSVQLKDDVLTLRNSKIERVFKFNNGHLITKQISNGETDYLWNATDNESDLFLPGIGNNAELISFRPSIVNQTLFEVGHIQTEIIYKIDKLFVKRIIRLYSECPAIATDFWFKGSAGNSKWYDEDLKNNSLSEVINVVSDKERNRIPVMDKIALPGKHWSYQVVDLFEMTDHLNDLVTTNNYQAYKQRLFRGNIFFAKNMEQNEGLFFLKEAPSPNAQFKYLSGDYMSAFGKIKMIGFGIDTEDIRPEQWTPAYSAVIGVYSGDEYSSLKSLRTYQDLLRKRVPERDEMIMMNTWGDRGQDRHINEKYILEELELCNKLGITHFQIDDGWQAGKSPASVSGGSFDDIWKRDDYWIPNKENFPSGFTNVVEKGKKLGIEICLWFNPSYTDNYVHWQKDAEVLVDLNKKYGIRVFKIDGLRIHNKISELRVDSFLTKVNNELTHNVVINLDVTADKRFGYLYKNKYGNIFLENRYTDFGNYYPYWTLRNLWKLSKYIPAQNLQIEFLNKWRNKEAYKNDIFAPELYDMEYLFAITMMAQPLAWMEAHNLPQEAFSIGEVIKKYKTISEDIHKGFILPIGKEPDGRSWTGFQSINNKYGYFLIFRELSEDSQFTLQTWLPSGTQIEMETILGDGSNKKISNTVNSNGEISFSLANKNSYVLYRYKIN